MRIYPPKKQTLPPHRQELTDLQKGRILEARGLRKSYTEISEELHIPRSTVVSFLHRFQERGSEENLPHTGRPRKTSASFDRYVIRTAQLHTDINNAALHDITNSAVSTSTIHRRLREHHIRKWRAVERALLMEKHVAKRLKWAREYSHFTREDWEQVFWSDECAVQKDSDGRQVWIFRHQNKREKYAAKNIRGREKGGGLFQMIWGCFAGSKLGPIVFIDGTVNTDVYIATLQDNLLPFIDAIIADGATNVIFQQDNATPHVSKRTHLWFESVMQEHEFKLMEWPPNSPDMNPIEHLWAHLKLELHKRYPDTKRLRGSPEAIKRVLRARLTEVWWDIGEKVLNGLINSMSHRVQALLAARGWYTEY